MGLTVIIPARNERYLSKTVADIYQQFTGDFEVIVVLDGYSDHEVPAGYPNLTVINKGHYGGIRSATNTAVSASQGEYILKVDAHCIFDKGFDETLLRDIDEESIMVARRWTLSLESWERTPRSVDYYYLSCPWTHPRPLMMQSCPWISHTEERRDIPIDELMCFQGSMWMMSRKHWDWLGGLEENGETYAEHHEISMKTWLGGRRVMINKNTWYAHPKDSVRGYHMSMNTVYRDHDHSARIWTENRWDGRVHDFDWLIDKFWPLPTETSHHRIEKYIWPECWREYVVS